MIALARACITSSVPSPPGEGMPLSALTPPVAYFCAIGMGFMLVEISQMQRLMVFLGHPVYGLSVVLFTILLFSGVGSTTVGARPSAGRGHREGCRTAGNAGGSRAVDTPVHHLGAVGNDGNAHLVSVLLLAPPAFCMGMMFPLGLSIWRRHPELLPFFWSANGIPRCWPRCWAWPCRSSSASPGHTRSASASMSSVH